MSRARLRAVSGEMRTAIVWFRRDLRVHDHPALTAAHREADRVVPVFVLDPRLLDAGRFPSANRAWFLLESLRELREALRARGGELFVRAGKPEAVLADLVEETGADAVHFASDVSPFAMARDKRVDAAVPTVRHPGNFGADAFVRQLAWRDFYAHVLLHHPGNAERAYKPQFDDLQWAEDGESLDAWREGRTGFPVVDAGMRQLLAVGWMHNRARLITASFLTKDLHIDWREGERHFMRHLLCGDEAQNNGNWQWITSIGVDPAPYFRRMYNPMTQQMRHDPDGEYVRRWCPELARVPLEHLAAPWEMSDAEQEAAGCVIGRDYPAPIVDHKAERERAMERYRAVSG